MKPKLLDLFCCAGGAGAGYHRAGFEITGVDISPQPRYPFEFIQADAIEYVREHGHLFDVIHASPPCQAFSTTRHAHSVEHPDLLGPTRDALEATWKPYVIENVPGAPLRSPLLLCGSEFGLRARDVDGVELAMRRHRLFESNVWLMGAGGCAHDSTQVAGSYTGSRHRKPEHRDNPERRGGYTPAVSVRADLLGVEWMNEREMAQAIPPAYTEHIGRQLMAHVQRMVA